MLFVKPQYNTWIELIYDQREDRIRKYADDILDNGFPEGVLMIDDNWQEDYGVWEFHPGRFTNPKDMMNDLHEQGFKVMLWICPYFSPDSETYRLLNKKGFFLRDKRGGTYMSQWWNGYSASLDLTNPEAVKYFQGRLAYLCETYGVDGFKLDAGDASTYVDKNIKASQDISPNEFSELWAKLGLPFKLNEYRACWKLAGQPLAQRLRDKGHNWEDLHQLIPDALAQGLMGYAYICPDMIGGGEYSYFYDNPDKPLDQELIVRSAQCSALMPMMQFSVAPWRVLSTENLAICRQMALLHEEMGPEIMVMVNSAAQSGEPIVRHLEYMYPHQGYEQIKDQFMLGDDILVAPVLEKGARSRMIVFPAGTWKGDDGSVVTGPCTQEVDVPLERLPWYRCIKKKDVTTQGPNVLFCLMDDASWPHMSAYGCSWVKTPAFDRLAEEGILFRNAYTPNAKCAPSRSSILTGRNSWQLEEAANHIVNFPSKFKTFPEVLRENGYLTGKTGKGWGPGNPGTVDGKPRELIGKEWSNHRTKPPASGMSKEDYAANFKDFLDRADRNPWFFWYGAREPHRPYEYGSGVKAGKKTEDIAKVPDFWPDDEIVRNDMLDYAFEIEHADDHLGRMIRILEKRGLLDNTIIVMTSDNGMPFPRCKAQEYEYSNHMPMAVMWPKGIKNPGRVVDDRVSFIDFAPTFLEVAGIPYEASGMHPSPGRSLTDIFYSEKAGQVTADRDVVLIGKERHDYSRPNNAGYPIRGIVSDDYLYLYNYELDRWPAGNPELGYLDCDGSPTKTLILNMRREGKETKYWQWSFGKRTRHEELFNLASDSECMDNLATRDTADQIRKEMKGRMKTLLKKQQDPRMFGNGDIFDAYGYSEEWAWNFYERFMAGEFTPARTGWVNPTDYEKAAVK
jgi:arylsulfatase A-like enzyme